jgi:UDP-N-acetylmuramoyl-L-alanyl-D-glutamate--2,6-diaminopimelate ligase
MSGPMTLSQLADGLFSLTGEYDPSITGMTADSRNLQKGDAFIAVQGLTAHGLDYLKPEQAAKAAVVLFEPPAPKDYSPTANAIAVPDLNRLQARLADRFFGSPSKALSVIGVTGTNGKTSNVQLLAEAFSNAGRKTGTIGTLGVGLFGNLKPGERTTPDVISVHRSLAQLRQAGAQVVACLLYTSDAADDM